MHKITLFVLWCLVVLAGSIQADEIYLKNDDRLSGKIVTLSDGKLVLESGVAGEVTIPLVEIRTFNSSTPLVIHLADGTVINQTVGVAEPGQFAISAGPALRAQTFSLADIVSINPEGKPKPKWTGSVSAAVTSTHGNTKAESVSASASMAKRTDKDRTTVSLDYAKSKQEDPDTGEENTSEDWWRAKGKYDYFFTDKFFGFVDGRYEKDAIADLDRRVLIGAGTGYQWIETERTSFSTELGLASLYERFDGDTDSNSELSIQAGYNFDTRINGRLRFLHDLTYYPSLDQFSDYYLTSTAELRATLMENMFANLKAIFNYDATPAVGQGHTDVKYILGVGLTF